MPPDEPRCSSQEDFEVHVVPPLKLDGQHSETRADSRLHNSPARTRSIYRHVVSMAGSGEFSGKQRFQGPIAESEVRICVSRRSHIGLLRISQAVRDLLIVFTTEMHLRLPIRDRH